VMSDYRIIQGDCTETLRSGGVFDALHLTFLDPPFNQNKDYSHHNDNLPDDDYWRWMQTICADIYRHTADGGAIYFMHAKKMWRKLSIAYKVRGGNFRISSSGKK